MENDNYYRLDFMQNYSLSARDWYKEKKFVTDSEGFVVDSYSLEQIVADLRVNFSYYRKRGIGDRPLTRLEYDLIVQAREDFMSRNGVGIKLTYLIECYQCVSEDGIEIAHELMFYKVIDDMFDVLKTVLSLDDIVGSYVLESNFIYDEMVDQVTFNFKRMFYETRRIGYLPIMEQKSAVLELIAKCTEDDIDMLLCMYEGGLCNFCTSEFRLLTRKAKKPMIQVVEFKEKLYDLDQGVIASAIIPFCDNVTQMSLSRVSHTFNYAFREIVLQWNYTRFDDDYGVQIQVECTHGLLECLECAKKLYGDFEMIEYLAKAKELKNQTPIFRYLYVNLIREYKENKSRIMMMRHIRFTNHEYMLFYAAIVDTIDRHGEEWLTKVGLFTKLVKLKVKCLTKFVVALHQEVMLKMTSIANRKKYRIIERYLDTLDAFRLGRYCYVNELNTRFILIFRKLFRVRHRANALKYKIIKHVDENIINDARPWDQHYAEYNDW